MKAWKFCASAVVVVCLCASVQASAAYWLLADYSNAQILKYDASTGNYLGVFAADAELAQVGDMTLGPDGDIYVSLHGLDGVSRYDGVTGVRIGAFAGFEPGSGPGVQSGINLDGPNGLAFGPDGDLYVAANHSDKVIQYEGTTGAMKNVMTSSALRGAFDLVFGPDGNFYVGSIGTHDAVLRWQDSTSTFEYFVSSGSGGLDEPCGLTFGPDGDLYVSTINTHQIFRYDGDSGAPLGTFVTDASLSYPWIAFGPDDDLYVVLGQGDGLFRYDGTTGVSRGVFAGADGLPGFVALLLVVPEPISVNLFGCICVVLLGRNCRPCDNH